MAAAASSSSSSTAAAAAATGAASSDEVIPVVERSSVKGIAARYRGQALVHRLSYLAEVDAEQRAEALALAAETAAGAGKNVSQYLSLCEAAGVDPDAAWVDSANTHTEAESTALERELNMKLAAQDRDGIQAAHNKLGHYYTSTGEGSSAISSFMRAREYCTPAQLVENTVAAVRAGLQCGQHDHIEALARQTMGAASHMSKADRAFLQAAVGVTRLARGHLASAAQAFLSCSDAIGSAYCDVIHNEDVAVGATLCSIAALDRSSGKRQTQESLAFRRMVAGVPDAAFLAESWAMGDFGAAVRCLEGMQDSIRRDAVFGPVASVLRTAALDRIVVDAISPFSRASLATMSARLSLPQEDLTACVVRLIESGKLAARLDTAAGVVVAKYSEQRPAVFAQALALAGSMDRDTKTTLLRSSMVQHGHAVRPQKAAKASGVGGVMAGIRDTIMGGGV